MVLPMALLPRFERLIDNYSCPVSRIEQAILTDFIKQGQSENFPTKMKIALTGLSVPVSLNLRYDSSSVSWNGKGGVEKPALSKYTRVSAAQMLKKLSI